MEPDQQVRAFLFVARVCMVWYGRGSGSFPGFPVVRNALDLGVEMSFVIVSLWENECEGCLVEKVFWGGRFYLCVCGTIPYGTPANDRSHPYKSVKKKSGPSSGRRLNSVALLDPLRSVQFSSGAQLQPIKYQRQKKFYRLNRVP